MKLSSLSTPPLRQQQQPPQPPTPPPGEEENPWDLTVLNHSREIYFLPGIDRLAASVAAQSATPVDVRVECNGQFLEYTLDGQNEEQPVSGSLNGTPFEMTRVRNERGDIDVEANTPAGSWTGTIDRMQGGGTHISANLGDMPIGQRIAMKESSTSDKVGEVIGNFACARLYEGFYRREDGYHMLGELGPYNYDANLVRNADGSTLIEGDLGDLHYRQTITPQPPRQGS